jgi:oligoendopeptidase F
MSEKPLPKREEISEEFRWRLEDIYPSTADWEKEAEEVIKLLSKMLSFQGHLGESAAVLADSLELRDHISRIIEKLFVYARMRRDEDNANSQAQARTDKAENLITQVQSALSFFTPELMMIPDEKIHEFIQSEDRLLVYRHHLEEILDKRSHILSTSEERILAELGEVLGAVDTTFTMLNNADIQFRPIHDEQGSTLELTKGRYSQFIESPDRTLRKEAFHSMHASYFGLKNTLAGTLSGSIKRDVVLARLRKYPSALEASLDQDKIPVSVYEELISTVHGFLPELHRYFSIRKKRLGLNELHFYDLYTPLMTEVEFKADYGEAKEQVIQGLAPLGQEYSRLLRQGLDGGWTDVYENQNKTSGAYAWGCYDSHPYVLLNHQPNLNSLLTLAHEMGHAMHSAFSNMHQSYINAEYRIVLAEVASTVNEVLVLESLLKQTSDQKFRLYLLNRFLEEFRTTVFRQTMFAEFERDLHQAVETGEALTAEFLSERYLRLNQNYHGPQVVLDEGLQVEWARIPHFYTAFYVYKYATGFSAAVALARGIMREGEPAVLKYLDFLKSGNSDYPLELLRRAGVDLATPQPVTEALQYFVELMNRFESEQS